MNFKSLLVANLLILGSLAHAGPVAQFLKGSEGRWTGSGQLIVQNLPTAGTYNIQIDRSTVAKSNSQWVMTTAITGAARPSSSVTRFDILGAELWVTAGPYRQKAMLKSANASTLSFETTHYDPVTSDEIRNQQRFTANANGTIHVVIDNIKNGSPIQHYDYTLKKVP